MRLVTLPATIRAAVDGDLSLAATPKNLVLELRHWRGLRHLPPSCRRRSAELVVTARAWYERGFAEHEATIQAAQEADAGVVREWWWGRARCRPERIALAPPPDIGQSSR
jgi:hypothetical protein